MATALTVTSVAFAAFCVWLTVRIVNRKERWAKWTLAVFVSLIFLYPMGMGPAVWLASRDMLPQWARRCLVAIYSPLEWIFNRSDAAFDLCVWYTNFWRPD